MIPADVPVDPDAPEARDWVLDELSKAPYQAAQPSLLDLIGAWLMDRLGEILEFLFGGAGALGEGGAPLWLALLIPVAVLVVIAFLVYGVPRLNRRRPAAGALFGEDDERDAAAMRRDAERAAGAGDFATAIAELFRALARGLAERTLVTTHPGTTASEFARRAAAVFPDAGEDLRACSAGFDAVRYLGHPGTREQWERIATLERRLRAARPAAEALETAGAGSTGTPR